MVNKYGVALVLEKTEKAGDKHEFWIGGKYFPLLKRKIREAEKESEKPHGKILVSISEADFERESKLRKGSPTMILRLKKVV
jgi:hypothetical protein